jgi:selenocysteine-specific elongation factor
VPIVTRRASAGVPRLPIDRSFVLKGFGTVVTGTLVSGTLREGQEVEILPSGRQGRVRGLQVHRRRVADAGAGMRVAVNLQGLDCEEAPRGATLTFLERCERHGGPESACISSSPHPKN